MDGLFARLRTWRLVVISPAAKILGLAYALVGIIDTVSTHSGIVSQGWLLAILPGWPLQTWILIGLLLTLLVALEGFYREIQKRDDEIARLSMPRLVMGQSGGLRWVHHRDKQYSHAHFEVDFYNKGFSPIESPRLQAFVAPLNDLRSVRLVFEHTAASVIYQDTKVTVNIDFTIPHTHDVKVPILIAFLFHRSADQIEANWLQISLSMKEPHSPSLAAATEFAHHLSQHLGVPIKP